MDLKPKPREFTEGDVLTAQELNELRDLGIRQIVPGRGVSIKRFSDRIAIDTNPEYSRPSITHMTCVVIQEFYDCLLCHPFQFENDTPHIHQPDKPFPDGITGGTDSEIMFYVAKPYLLQRTPWDGKSVLLGSDTVKYTYADQNGQRTASEGQVFEQQQITPPYFPGDIITARRNSTGYKVDQNGPHDVFGALLPNPQGVIEWIDANEGGRQWAAQV